jgi:CHAT domain-containing protein/tetratricopeptide (TPR) repeat protein
MSHSTRNLAAALATLLACGTAANAQTPLAEPDAAVRAEKLYLAGKLVDAEKLYLAALRGPVRVDVRLCYERLLGIYGKLGREDRAVQIGLEYKRWLDAVPDPARVRTLKGDLGLWYFALGHHATSAALLREALADPTAGAFDAPTRLALSFALARVVSRQNSAERMAAWHDVERAAQVVLATPQLPVKDTIQPTWVFAESLRQQKKYDAAIEALRRLLPLLEDPPAPLSKRDTIRRIAQVQLADNRFAAAKETLDRALLLHKESDADNHLLGGDLAADVTELYTIQKDKANSATWREKAAKEYRAVVDDPRMGSASRYSAFWKLQRLLQDATHYRAALQLTVTQAEDWAGTPLVYPRLHADHGALEMLVGSYAKSLPLLRNAVAELESQKPNNLNELPRAFNNCATVELATGDAVKAETLAKKTLELYRQHKLPDDRIVVESCNLLGMCAAQSGEFAQAIAYYRDGLARCDRLETGADPPRSKLHLNIALLHQSQGDLEEALRACRQAHAIYKRFGDPEGLELAAFEAAEINFLVALGRSRDAAALAERLTELCVQHKIIEGPLFVTARHCQGLHALSTKRLAEAERIWCDLLAVQEREKHAILLPRTLNYLALCAEIQGHKEEADSLYRRAHELQRDNVRAFPITRFISLWRLAELEDRRQRSTQAKDLLMQGTGLVEKARLRTYGDALQRATFFAQFSPGFDRLVEWNVRDGDYEAAFAAVVQGRSRTLLDQLHLARIDPREGSPGAERWILQEQSARKRIAALRAKAQLLPVTELDGPEAKRILAEYDQAQKDYTDAWREILNAHPLYRSLEGPPPDLLARLRKNLLGPKSLMLAYYFGEERSYAFLIGDASRPIEVFPLTVPAVIAQRGVSPDPPTLAEALGSRGITVKRKSNQVKLPDKVAAGPRVALGSGPARVLVDHYCLDLADPDFTPTRGISVRSRDPMKALPDQRPELFADVFLPEALRTKVRDSGAESLLVVPDGPLHRLPLEAILIHAGPEPRYVLDEFPPIHYAPSASILALLADRPAISKTAAGSLLSVGNPAYPQKLLDKVKSAKSPKADADTQRSILSLQGQLPLLPGSAEECKKVRAHFTSARVVSLEGPAATERDVARAVAGKQFVHIAAHGFADERFGNLFGALALTPPAGESTPDNDGFLTLHEIYRLPLSDCDLAVLSACVTNVGPQQPLEAGVTLATGFLSAGARRVVASHWNVDDASTAVLMDTFFRDVTSAGDSHVSYARALQDARKRVRSNREWAAPYHWAAFVLIGPDR